MSETGPEGFAQELRAVGYAVHPLSERFIVFCYEVDVGPLDGLSIKIGLEPIDHPRSPVTGPFVSPRLLPLRADASPAPLGGILDAASRGFPDPEGIWQYWSRPFNEWGEHGRTATSYLHVHLRRLFAGLPSELVLPCAD
jgi:hypothetical protein